MEILVLKKTFDDEAEGYSTQISALPLVCEHCQWLFRYVNFFLKLRCWIDNDAILALRSLTTSLPAALRSLVVCLRLSGVSSAASFGIIKSKILVRMAERILSRTDLHWCESLGSSN